MKNAITWNAAQSNNAISGQFVPARNFLCKEVFYMIRFGPSGNSDSFYNQGFKSTLDAAAWLKNMGLDAYEYSFGRGIGLSLDMAAKIGRTMAENGIMPSVHAPYYINLANPDPQKRQTSLSYILDSAVRAKEMGADRVVVHVGSPMKMPREEALKNCRDGLISAQKLLDENNLAGIHLCPEAMGKKGQIGNLEETLDFCRLEERFIPCLDFAHIHALHQGRLNTIADFEDVLNIGENILGLERMRNMHVHFSTIEYTSAGEKRHRTFAEAEFGPRFHHLAPLLNKRRYTPRIICECRGTQAEDAAEMKKIWEAL